MKIINLPRECEFMIFRMELRGFLKTPTKIPSKIFLCLKLSCFYWEPPGHLWTAWLLLFLEFGEILCHVHCTTQSLSNAISQFPLQSTANAKARQAISSTTKLPRPGLPAPSQYPCPHMRSKVTGLSHQFRKVFRQCELNPGFQHVQK